MLITDVRVYLVLCTLNGRTDLSQATRVANTGPTRLRVVSLSGELIDTSGTMAGGGTRVQRGGMSSKFAGDEISPKQLQKEEKAIEVERFALSNYMCCSMHELNTKY